MREQASHFVFREQRREGWKLRTYMQVKMFGKLQPTSAGISLGLH